MRFIVQQIVNIKYLKVWPFGMNSFGKNWRPTVFQKYWIPFFQKGLNSDVRVPYPSIIRCWIYNGHCTLTEEPLSYRTNYKTSFSFYIPLNYPKIGLLHEKPLSVQKSSSSSLPRSSEETYLPFPVRLRQFSYSAMACRQKTLDEPKLIEHSLYRLFSASVSQIFQFPTPMCPMMWSILSSGFLSALSPQQKQLYPWWQERASVEPLSSSSLGFAVNENQVLRKLVTKQLRPVLRASGFLFPYFESDPRCLQRFSRMFKDGDVSFVFFSGKSFLPDMMKTVTGRHTTKDAPPCSGIAFLTAFEAHILFHPFLVVSWLIKRKAVSARMQLATGNTIGFTVKTDARASKAVSGVPEMVSVGCLMVLKLWFNHELGEIEVLASHADGLHCSNCTLLLRPL